MRSRFPHGGEVLGAAPANPLLAPVLSKDLSLSMSRQRELLDLQAIQRIPGLVGYWKPDPQYLFEDSAGTTPASTSGTGPVGQWRAVGVTPTLTAVTVANSGFDADSDWTKGTGWTIGSGVATKTAGSAAALSQAITLTAGSVYLITWTLTRTSGTLLPRFTGGTTVSGTALSASGTYSENLVAVTGNTTMEFYGDASFAGTVDDVSVVLLTGVVAVEATTALKPILRKTPTTGVCWADSNTSASALNVALGNLGSACTLARATAEGVTFTENVSITSTYNIAPAFSFNSDVAIFNRALTAIEKALITRYMARAVPMLGSNLIINGTFDTDTTGWVARLVYGVGATSVTDGVVSISGNGVDIYGALAQVPIPAGSVGTQFFVKARLRSVSGGNSVIRCTNVDHPNKSPSLNNFTTTFANLEYAYSQTAALGTGILIGANSVSGTAEFDDISMRQIL